MTRHKLAKKLKSRPRLSYQVKGYSPSAVLVPFTQINGEYHLIFTKRSNQVRHHKNQISFPGGMKENADQNLLQTALRETEEEIGIPPQKIEILGQLTDHYSPYRYRIRPFVAFLKNPLRFKLNREEIRQILRIPLCHLLDPKNLRVQKAEFFSKDFEIPFYYFKKHVIWGATGRITRDVLDLLS